MTYVPENAFEAFAIRLREAAQPIVMTQTLGARVVDHRGLIDLPALMVLFDDLGGISFGLADRSASSLQARLSVSMGSRPAPGDIVTGDTRLVMADEAFGSTAVSISRGDETIATGTARSVRVGRAVIGESQLVVGEALPVPDDGPVPPPIEESMTGAQIVASIADGSRPIGPIAQLLGGSITDPDPAALKFTVDTAPWMGNFFGTMHGGIIATIVAQAASFGVAANLRAGVGYQLIEFTVAFLRSPAVDGQAITAAVKPVKIGRRIATVDVELHDAEGALLARATADARCDR